jgi:hypothetical protein
LFSKQGLHLNCNILRTAGRFGVGVNCRRYRGRCGFYGTFAIADARAAVPFGAVVAAADGAVVEATLACITEAATRDNIAAAASAFLES